VASPNVSVDLYIYPASDPISGSLVYPDGSPQPFSGWIELTAALEDVRQGGEFDVVAHGKKRAAQRPLDG
jgi:hypothetical protein